MGNIEVLGLSENESRSVELRMVFEDLQEKMLEGTSEAPVSHVQQGLVPSVEDWADQAVLFDELAAAAQGSEAELYRRLAEHRRSIVEMKGDMATARELRKLYDESTDPVERQELFQEELELRLDILEDVLGEPLGY